MLDCCSEATMVLLFQTRGMRKVVDVDGGSRHVLAVLSQSTNCYFCLLRLEVKVPAIYFKWLEENEVREGEKIYKTIRGWISTSLEAAFVCVSVCGCMRIDVVACVKMEGWGWEAIYSALE